MIYKEDKKASEPYYGQAVVRNKRTAFGSISHKRMVPMSISTMHESSSKNLVTDQTLFNYQSIQNEAADEYQENFHKTNDSEVPPNYELMSTSISRVGSSKMSHPILNRKPITQHGAVKAVNLFGSFIKDTLNVQDESSAVARPVRKRPQSSHILANFGSKKSRSRPRIHSGIINSSHNTSEYNNDTINAGNVNQNSNMNEMGIYNFKNVPKEPQNDTKIKIEERKHQYKASYDLDPSSSIIGASIKLNSRPDSAGNIAILYKYL